MARKRYQIYLDEEDWDYIQKLSEVTGMSASALVRDCVQSFVGVMRRSLGDDLSQDRYSVTDFTRVMLVETSNALKDLSQLHRPPQK